MSNNTHKPQKTLASKSPDTKDYILDDSFLLLSGIPLCGRTTFCLSIVEGHWPGSRSGLLGIMLPWMFSRGCVLICLGRALGLPPRCSMSPGQVHSTRTDAPKVLTTFFEPAEHRTGICTASLSERPRFPPTREQCSLLLWVFFGCLHSLSPFFLVCIRFLQKEKLR